MKNIWIIFTLTIAFVYGENRKNFTTTTTIQSTTTTPACSEEHEIYNNCGTACPPSCDVPYVESCTNQCIAGCFCEAGYVRGSRGNCIPAEQCPKPTPSCEKDHEYFTECGSACPVSCDTPSVEFCTLQCVPGCFCEYGYVRDRNGDCIALQDCPKSPCQKSHEVYSNCYAHMNCQHTCSLINGGRCPRRCYPGCMCKDGYVRDTEWNCILLEECPDED